MINEAIGEHMFSTYYRRGCKSWTGSSVPNIVLID